MSIKLRELIRNVRACKTAAEERAVIAKECALCRTAFRAKDCKFRHRNVAKLLYIHMLGYPTHFAQMELMKLIASPRFPEKRIGYLALMILLDERQGVLMLVTNSLKNDFHHKNPYVVGLALASLGNISSTDMARDLASEVEKFFGSPNAYLRKKAALCAIRIIRKVPDAIEDFIQPVLSLLNDKNHAVSLTAISLIIEMTKIEPKTIKKFRKLVPQLVRLLKSLVLAGYVSEYDVVGITDPFLQAKIIQLFRVLGQGNADASDHMNDILAQVAINTEPTKNPGNAILYECVMTIMSIEAEGGLRVLAINILGRFLLNRDNNIRYVALNTLCKVVNRDTQAIQRHRNTIVDCLKDVDISIRRRALDLIYALVAKNNVKALVKELLNYLALTSGDEEFKSDLTDKICLVAERYAPSRRWHIDTMVNVLSTAGSYTRSNVATDLIQLISRSKSLHAYSVHKLFVTLQNKEHMQQIPLVHVAMWCVGEFGDVLVSDEGVQQANGDLTEFEKTSEGAVLQLIQNVMDLLDATEKTHSYALNACIKLTERFSDDSQEKLLKLIGTHKTSMSLELQQRSVEYNSLSSAALQKVRSGVMVPMPVMVKKKTEEKAISKKTASKKKKPVEDSASDDSSDESGSDSGSDDDDDDDDSESDSEEEEEVAPKKAKKKPTKKETRKKKPIKKAPAAAPAPAASPDLLDLDLFGGMGAPAATSAPVQAAAPTADAGGLDLLGGLFGAPAQTSAPAAAAGSEMDLDMFGVAAPVPAGIPDAVVFQSKGLVVTFKYNLDATTPGKVDVVAQFTNTTGGSFTNFDFRVAVPKYIKMNMKSASSTTVPANNGPVITQPVTLTNSQAGKKKLMVRMKITYTANGQSITEQTQTSNFPGN